jgi:integrase
MKTAVPHLHRDRHGTYYFRVTEAGKTIKRSLRTKSVDLATMRASCLNWEWETMNRRTEPTIADIQQALADGRVRKFDVELPNGVKLKNINNDDDAERAKRLLESIGPITQPIATRATIPEAPRTLGPFFRAATKSYIKELRQSKLTKQKSIEDKDATYEQFATQFKDPNCGAVTKQMVLDFKQEQLKHAQAGRVNTKIGHLSAFFDWAVGHEFADSNPFAGTRIGKKSQLMKGVQSYEPFTAADLKAIFNPNTYPEYGSKAHFHWLPFLLLYTGARPEELASLRLDDVRTEQGIDYFALKSGKNSNSIRKIPFHKAVRASGFPAYVKGRRMVDPGGMLFPLLTPSKNGYAKNVSRRFNESYLPSLRITEQTKRLYSFRSTFITRMTELNANTAMLMAIVGHFEQQAVNLSSPHFKNYQGAKQIAALRDTMNRFDIKVPMKF